MTERPTLRERSRLAARDHAAEVALRLFVEQGFDATTVDQIAAEAGMSTRTFFRYFPTKEDVVVGDPTSFGRTLRDLVTARPATESAWAALIGAVHDAVDHVERTPAALEISTIMLGTPSLRARHIEKQRLVVDLVLPEVLRRLGDVGHARLRAVTAITAALAVFDACLGEWVDHDGRVDLRELVRDAVATLTRDTD